MADRIITVSTTGRTIVTPGAELIAPLTVRAEVAAEEAEAARDETRAAASTALASTRYFATRAAGEAGSATDQMFSTGDGNGNVVYYRKTAGGSVEIGRALTPAALAADGGAALVGYKRAGAADLLSTLAARLSDLPHTAREHGVVADFDRLTGIGTDNTAALQRMMDRAVATGLPMQLPIGRIMVTDTLFASAAFKTHTAGPALTEIVMVSSTPKPIIHVRCGDNSSIIGLDIQGIRFVCDGFGYGINCDAIVMDGTASNSAYHACYVQNNEICNPRRGISIDAVFYRCVIQNNTITRYFGGSVTEYGIYCDSIHDVTYNQFLFNEVTNVGDRAWAYWLHSDYTQFIGNTCDSYCYFSSPGGRIIGLAIETIHPDLPPIFPEPFATLKGADVPAIIFNQVEEASFILRGVVNAKANVGALVIGNGVFNSPRCIAPQPDAMFKLTADSRGVINAPNMTSAVKKLEDNNSAELLRYWDLRVCGDISKRTSVPKAWPTAPSFTTWQSAPTVNGTTYAVNGAVLTAVIDGFGGSITAPGSTIGNLPITPGAAGVATLHSSSDASLSATGSVVAGNNSVLSLPPIDLSGKFWQLTVQYFL